MPNEREQIQQRIAEEWARMRIELAPNLGAILEQANPQPHFVGPDAVIADHVVVVDDVVAVPPAQWAQVRIDNVPLHEPAPEPVDFERLERAQNVVMRPWDGNGVPAEFMYLNGMYWSNGRWYNIPNGFVIRDENDNRFQFQAAPRGLKQKVKLPEPEVPDVVFEEAVMARKLPPFKMPYGTVEEANLRLKNTIVIIKGNPVIVYAVDHGLKPGDIRLYVKKEDGSRGKLLFKDIDDLRSPAPGYVDYAGQPVWLSRAPERIFQQGLSPKNCMLTNVGRRGRLDVFMDALLPGLKDRKVKQFADAQKLFDQGVRAVRLSDHVAVYTQRKSVVVEYKGRLLGYVRNGEVLVEDMDDLIPTWIGADLNEVGLALGVA